MLPQHFRNIGGIVAAFYCRLDATKIRFFEYKEYDKFISGCFIIIYIYVKRDLKLRFFDKKIAYFV